MKLIAIQNDILINPDKIVAIERTVNFEGLVSLRVFVEGRTYEVTTPHKDFLDTLNKSDIDLSKQFFAG